MQSVAFFFLGQKIYDWVLRVGPGQEHYAAWLLWLLVRERVIMSRQKHDILTVNDGGDGGRKKHTRIKQFTTVYPSNLVQ